MIITFTFHSEEAVQRPLVQVNQVPRLWVRFIKRHSRICTRLLRDQDLPIVIMRIALQVKLLARNCIRMFMLLLRSAKSRQSRGVSTMKEVEIEHEIQRRHNANEDANPNANRSGIV